MCSSSSSGSSQAGKKKKKGKKEKKSKSEKKAGKKADKKEEKKAKKAEKSSKHTQAWEFDRAEVVRLIESLLQLDPRIADELKGVFQQIDTGDTVRIDGLDNKQAKKKLRHLFQALRLLSTEDHGFKTPSRKVSFVDLFQESLGKARRADTKTTPGPASIPAPVRETAAQAACKRELERELADAAGTDADRDAADGRSDPSIGNVEADTVAAPAKKKIVGPQRPGADIGPAGPSSDEDEDEDELAPADAGPRLPGEEREGVDINDLPEQSQRQAWMSMPEASIEGAFGGGGPSRKGDVFAVKRSAEEQAEFEKMYLRRGTSLIQQQREGKFAGDQENIERARKRTCGPSDAGMWGMSAKEQERGGTDPTQTVSVGRKTFDPEQDLRSSKPMTSTEFSSLLEASATGLTGRFSRSAVATSFL